MIPPNISGITTTISSRSRNNNALTIQCKIMDEILMKKYKTESINVHDCFKAFLLCDRLRIKYERKNIRSIFSFHSCRQFCYSSTSRQKALSSLKQWTPHTIHISYLACYSSEKLFELPKPISKMHRPVPDGGLYPFWELCKRT